MSEIRIVDDQYRQHHSESAMCEDCGCGVTIIHTVDDKVELEFPDNRKQIGMKCECGGILEHEVRDFDQRVPGWVEVKCDCGETVCCAGFTSTCECGADYNWNGTQLAPRRLWGEETGEYPGDIARI